MACYHPISAYRAKARGANGKFGIVFNASQGYVDQRLKVPCGQCVGCRLERSRQWAIRCVHEASLHEKNCFITLTYNDEFLPKNRSLCIDHFQKFMKRLRKKFGANIRFYHCGEYGSKYGRPHYHALLFNLDFSDKKLWKIVNEQKLYTSKILEELWPFGFSTVGTATFESAAYVARYIMKKVNGTAADSHYERVDPDTGEVYRLKSEYTTMSRRPGIGKNWFEKFKKDVFPSDQVVLKGRAMRPPRYYDIQFEIDDEKAMSRIKTIRKKNSKKHIDNNTPERLNVRERVQLARLALLPRSVD